MLKLSDEYLKDVLVRLAHHSTAIEGNTLSLPQTVSIILENSLPPMDRSVNLREIFEVKNHEQAFHYMLHELGQDQPLTLETVKGIHAALTDHLQHDRGQFKQADNAILGAEFQTASAAETPLLMRQWIDNLTYRLENTKKAGERYLAISEAHIAFERIHPFSDGNGRTGRMVMNYSLLQNDLPPVVISKDDRATYMSLLAKQDGAGLSRYIQDVSKMEWDRIQRFQNQQKEQITVDLPPRKSGVSIKRQRGPEQ